MSLTKRIAHNTFIQTLGKIVSTALGVFVLGLLTRYLGVEDYGRYATIIAFLQIFAVVLDLGLYIVLIKKISEPEIDTDRYVSNVFTLRFFSALAFLGLAPIIVLFFPYPTEVKVGIAFTTLSYLFISLNQVLTGLFQKNLRMDKVALAEVVGRFVLLGATGLVLWFRLNLYAVLGAVILGSFANFLYVFLSSRQFVRLSFAVEWPIWRQVLTEAWPIGLSVALNLVYFKADTVILSLYRPAADVGIYGATYKVLEILVTLPAMFAGLVMPLITAAFAAGNLERFRFVLQRSFDFLALMALPLVAGTFFISQPLMVLIAGAEFSAAGSVLNILVIATGIIFLGSLFGNAVVAVNKQKAIILFYLLVAVVSLAGYLVFIPRYGYFGAAWMTVVSEGLIMTSCFLVVYRATKARLRLAPFFKTVLATLIMAGCLWLVRDLTWYWLALVGLAVYSAALLLLRVVTKQEVKEMVSISQ